MIKQSKILHDRILPAEFDYIKLGMSAEDAELIATRQFEVNEIARIFQVPPHMIAELSKATFSNIEHQNINFVQFSVAHWLLRISAEINEKLFEFGDIFCEFDHKGLLRGDMKAQSEMYSKAGQLWMTVNEIRRRENLPPAAGGDVLRVPVNVQPADQISQEQDNA